MPKKKAENRQEPSSSVFLNNPIGSIAKRKLTFSPETLGKDVLAYLQNHQHETDIVIVEKDVPLGLINKDSFLSQLATNYGLSIYSRRPIRLLLEAAPFQLDCNCSIDEAIRQAMQRSSDHIYDSIIITKNHRYFGTATIKDLLEISTKIELNRAKDANPLTNLPGNKMIESELLYYSNRQLPFTAIYIDLDNFKAYNDIYGFAAGDRVLLSTAAILNQCAKEICPKSFVGHIGGDDFILFLPGTDYQKICDYIIEVFANKAKTFYSKEHQMQGYIIAKNRQDQLSQFPLMTLSLAVLLVKTEAQIPLENLSKKAASIKKVCKKHWENNYVMETIA
jgi:diguanylate cyclase (GGDEF)-like protein